jgi:MYXO-CTERM domain-containing protein
VERTRVAQHIFRAETQARRRKVRLRPLQRLARALLLRELAHYRARGRFPKNRDFSALTPYFIDAEGTRCAVAHLLDASGEPSLVERIARQRNHARVAELANEPRLVAWLDAAGLSLEEAAQIQPSYCFDRRGCVCDGRASGYFEVSTSDAPKSGVVTARVEAIHGTPSEDKLQIGDEVRVEVGPSVELGTELVVSGYAAHYEQGEPIFRGTTFPYSCGGGSPELSKEQYLQAVLADDCEAKLDAFGDWDPPCDGCGCRAVGPGSATSWGVVAALLGLAISRRMQRAVR